MSRFAWVAIGTLTIISIALRHQVLFLMSLTLIVFAIAVHFWGKYCLHNVTYQRYFETNRLFFGEETAMRVEIVNAKPLPVAWLRVDDEVPQALELSTRHESEQLNRGRRRLVHVFSLRWYERVIRRYRVRGTKRGIWEFGPTTLRSGDLFGFDIQREAVDETIHLLVYPRLFPLETLGFPAQHPFGDFQSQQRLVQDPLRLMGAREYSSGDSYRHIHWKATARRQALQTKVFEPSASKPTAIFLNVDTYDRFHEGQDYEIREFAISAAASIGRQLWEDDHALGLYANTMIRPIITDSQIESASRIRIPPRRHPAQLVYILEALAKIDYGRGRWPFPQYLTAASRRLPYGATIVVVTAVITQALHLALTDLRRKHYGVALVGVGAAQLEKPIPGVDYFYLGGRERWQALEAEGAEVKDL